MAKRSHVVSLLDKEDSQKDSKSNIEKENERNKRQKGQNETAADANNNVISLLDSDEEGDAEFDQFLASNPKSALSKTSSTNIKKEGGSKNDNDGGGKLGATGLLQQGDDDVMVVDPVVPEIHPAAAAAASASKGDEDDIQLVGTANETRLPHMRQHCTEHPFVSSGPHAKTSNETYCDLCYCYVCDKPAKECAKWTSPSASQGQNHCMATDSGAMAPLWRSLRQQAKNQPAAASFYERSTSRTPTAARTPVVSTREIGPYPPKDTRAARDSSLTACRKCGWYSRFAAQREPCCHDWCHACGRVAIDSSFGRLQAGPFAPDPTDIFLGEREVSFRLHAHDPRLFDKYKANWEANAGDPKWTYNESEMEQDLFWHRFGSHPCIEMILASIPVVAEDKIPKSGSVRETRPRSGEAEELSADETEAIILSDRNDRVVLEELLNFGTIGFKDRKEEHALLDGEIVAAWHQATRSGTFKIRVYLPLRSRRERNWETEQWAQFSKFLGAWFDVFPFSLSELCGPLRASNDLAPGYGTIYLPLPPFRKLETLEEKKNEIEKISETVDGAIAEFNERASLQTQKMTLVSGSKSDFLGGICSSGAGLASVLKGYFRETVPEDIHGIRPYYGSSGESLECWLWRDAGLSFGHYRHSTLTGPMKQAGDSLVRWDYHRVWAAPRRPTKRTSFLSYIADDDHVFAQSSLFADIEQLVDNTQSLADMMGHLENLHHASALFVEGLNVELLEFQRQSLQWALEREKTPGGVQSFFWAKLPSVAHPGTELYFNPILDRFRSDKPRLVRGGIIAEEMGLGKTVISLALILENPAPEFPVSGSPVSALTAPAVAAAGGLATSGDSTSIWDKDLYARTSESNKKRGSILSRGTLVVCHVSLVGQWIDEAKSKLKDPGLVYPYHGQSRKRDAAILAKNAIVVTTYQTLASDATFHAKKHGASYCPPCEQVRWWRVICDESHSLREANTKKSQAVMNLVADHKWLVSGTPINTTFKDLTNQLNFLGLENVEELFRVFGRTAFYHFQDPAMTKRTRRRRYLPEPDPRKFGHFVFFLRNVMIRHTHKQKYRGTDTTLMSLPPKTERTIEVEFTAKEKQEYSALDTAAREFYVDFKDEKGDKLNRHFLLLSQKLTPLRIAASGGHIPLEDEKENEYGENENEHKDDEEENSDSETETKKKARKKKTVKYSDFAYTSKFNTLVTELKHIRDNEPDAKSLVFSQFTTTLEFLQQELPKHGFQFRTLSGDMTMKKRAKALHDFQNDPPTTIFLLSMRAGAVGINLTQANRVLLMEPHFNPALEAQAIGRVHRLGQKRNVEIIRLVMKDSVETRLIKMLQKKYGRASGHGTGDDDGDEEIKPAAVPVEPTTSLIGSIHTDKTTVLAAEFDLLFGVASDESTKTEDPGEANGGSVDV